ncbi:TM53B-like protein [Mya arenaria]|uniref:TM53B-like protein n=2 Tax=Mya arenaria TaxID=6604 RepID=A0ABY7FQ15_MYAAR|nr:TM53B-like protein [Mya arenaria]
MFHIFSNNGSYVYSHIVKLLTSGDERYKFVSVCGVIIDSAPGKPRFVNAAKAYGASLHVNPVLKCMMMFGLLMYLVVNGWAAKIWSMLNPKYKQKSNHFLFDNMAEDPTRWPMLFLYSTSDKIVHYYDIEDMMSQRRALGVNVSSVCWDDTDHVSHLRKHQEEYEQACENFLEYCVSGAVSSFDVAGAMSGLEADEEEVEGFETEEDYLLAKKQ